MANPYSDLGNIRMIQSGVELWGFSHHVMLVCLYLLQSGCEYKVCHTEGKKKT